MSDSVSSEVTGARADKVETVTPAQQRTCVDCDLNQHVPPLEAGQSAQCVRCGAVLARRSRFGPDHCLAFALCALILYPVANGFHLLSLSLFGNAQTNLIWTGVTGLWQGGLHAVAVLVLFCVMVAPLALILSLLYLYIPRPSGRKPRYAEAVHRGLHVLDEWAMIDVFLLAAVVSYIKLSQLAAVSVETGLFALIALLAAIWAAWLAHNQS